MYKKNIISTSECKKKNKKKKKSSTQAKAATVSKTRSRTRKPKYMSLKLQLTTCSSNNKNITTTNRNHKNKNTQQRKKPQRSKKMSPNKKQDNKMSPPKTEQLNLFPLHPENLNKLDMQELEHNHVALLFETETDDASTTLHSLLDTTTTTNTTSTVTTKTEKTEELACPVSSSSSPLIMYRERCCLLEKAAMRCKERDSSEERWVSYCEVVMESSSSSNSKRRRDLHVQEEVTSNNHKNYDVNYDYVGISKNGLVGLKLDNYEEILNAWSDRGSLYIDGGGDHLPQTVPDLHDISHSNALDGWGSIATVPEMEGNAKMKGKILKDGEGGLHFGNREASLLRYKEKRQSRLFAKRIRYEVRKLNAEKRPRLKGRFVKRSEEEEEE